MCESLKATVCALQGFMESFDPRSLSKEQSAEVFELFVLAERLGAAGKALTSLQVADTNAWYDYKSPSHFMADKSKCTGGTCLQGARHRRVDAAHAPNREGLPQRSPSRAPGD